MFEWREIRARAPAVTGGWASNTRALPESELSRDNKYNHNQTDQIDHPVHATPLICQARRVPPAIYHRHVEGLFGFVPGLKESVRKFQLRFSLNIFMHVGLL
jgi:hypothetical protein